MQRSTCRRFIPAVVAVLAFSFSVFAQGFLLDDLEHGKNGPNKVGQYWYTFNSRNILTNHQTTLQAIPGGNASSSWAVGMVFSGLADPAAKTAHATVGLGTNISASDGVGYGSGFNGVTGFSFWANGPVGLVINFNVETIENAQPPSPTRVTDNSYTRQVTITNSGWNLYTVNISQLAQENWGTETVTYPFRNANVTKLSWSLKSASNNVNAGTFLVDDVMILGTFTHAGGDPGTDPPPAGADLCAACVSDAFTIPAPSVLLSDFEATDPGKNAVGYYWYEYSDASISGTSTATKISYEGAGRVGGGATTAYSMGSPIPVTGQTYTIAPFVGLGSNLYNDKADPAKYLDGSNFPAATGGVYFEYRTTGAAEIKFEVYDNTSVTKNNGEDYYIKLPGTNGAWKSATVRFSDLVLPSYMSAAEKTARGALNRQNLAKVQFVHNGSGSGSISVDNVYFFGDNKFNITTGGGGPDDPPPPPGKIILTYQALDGGTLSVGGVKVSNPYIVELEQGATGPAVTAVPDAGYEFVKWSDNSKAAARPGDVASANRTIYADFDVAAVVPKTFTITYRAGDGGKLSVAGASVASHEVKGEAGKTGEAVTAAPDENYDFVSWSDGKTGITRTDIVAEDATFTAVFVPKTTGGGDPDVVTYDVIYIAGGGGQLRLDGMLAGSFSRKIEEGKDAPVVEAIPDNGYEFDGWDDGKAAVLRTDTGVDAPLTVTAKFKKIVTGVAESGRVIHNDAGTAVIAPPAATAGEFTAGPSVASKRSGNVNFFWTGNGIGSGKLIIYDASGNVVKRMNTGDKSIGASGKRAVGSWDLTDKKGRAVAEGTYLVNGIIKTRDGKKEKVLAMFSVVK